MFVCTLRCEIDGDILYDMRHDVRSLLEKHRSINLLDFSKQEDIYLIDEWSDATEHGGLSETELMHNKEDECLTIQSLFRRIPEGVEFPSKVMFSG